MTSTDGHARVAEVARGAYPRLRRTAAAANDVVSGMDAALSLSSAHPLRRGLLDEMEAHAREVLADSTISLAVS